uniref:Uncharacterized protein n=1 Tax=Dulem virus 42 TaxID=3145760 RepID=A0AAU8B7E3_9CAUD
MKTLESYYCFIMQDFCLRTNVKVYIHTLLINTAITY